MSLIATLRSSTKYTHVITQWTHSRARLPLSGQRYCAKKMLLRGFHNSKKELSCSFQPLVFPLISSLSPQFVFRQAVAETAPQLFQAFVRSQQSEKFQNSQMSVGREYLYTLILKLKTFLSVDEIPNGVVFYAVLHHF